MKQSSFIALMVLVTVFTGCGINEHKAVSKQNNRSSEKRNTPTFQRRQSFKGWELYFWKPAGQDWHFHLMLGTNRCKRQNEIYDPAGTVIGVENIKPQLARLAEGERIRLWDGQAVIRSEPLPKEIIDELKMHCNNLKIELYDPYHW